MSTKLIFKYFVSFALILLWVYAAASKLMDWDHFKWEMRNQVLPVPLKEALIYVLPLIELITAGLLIYEKTFAAGIWSSLILLTLFTGYIGLVLGHTFRHIPCSCGGILQHMGWTEHLVFNLFFAALTIATILIFRRGGKVTAS